MLRNHAIVLYCFSDSCLTSPGLNDLSITDGCMPRKPEISGCYGVCLHSVIKKSVNPFHSEILHMKKSLN